MNSKSLFLMCSFLFLTSMLQAQSSEVLAKSAILNAEESYNNGQYQTCINFLNNAVANLGSTNSRIQYLKVKALLATYKPDTYDKTIVQINKEINVFFKVTPENSGYPPEKYDEMLIELVKVKKWTDSFLVAEKQQMKKNREDSLTTMSNIAKINILIDNNKVSDAYEIWKSTEKDRFYSERLIRGVNQLKSFEINRANKVEYNKLMDEANKYHLESEQYRKSTLTAIGFFFGGIALGSLVWLSPSTDLRLVGTVLGGILVIGGGYGLLSIDPFGYSEAIQKEKSAREKAKGYLSISPIINSNNIGVYFSYRF